MRINLTKKDLINQIYMQLGFSKLVSENLINDFFSSIILNLKEEKKLKLSGFGTFSIRRKKSLASKIDPKITNRIWKNMIWSYIDYEKRNFKKK